MKRVFSTLSQKWPEYLLEILVITIGILGAFSLNNWNDARKSEKQFRTILSLVKTDILSDIYEFDSARVDYDRRIETMRLMYMDSVSRDKYFSSNIYLRAIAGYEDILVDTRGIELLNQNTALDDEDQLAIANKINSFYSDRIHEITISEKELAETLEFYRSEWTTTSWWFSGMVQKDHTPFAEYAWDNEPFRRNIYSYASKLSGFRKDWMIYKEQGLKLVDEIDTYLKN